MAKIPCYLLSSLLFVSLVAADIHVRVTDNPADELVEEINKNRTAARASALYSNPGLACIALQYIKAYGSDCGAVGGSKKPSDSHFAETFAPNCGIKASTLSPITGRFIACQSGYADPTKAFSEILMKSKESLEIVHRKNHTEVGAAVSGSDGGGPYFWCVLFSSGAKNASFVAEGGVVKIPRPGCFSGSDDQCSRASNLFASSRFLALIIAASVTVGFTFGL